MHILFLHCLGLIIDLEIIIMDLKLIMIYFLDYIYNAINLLISDGAMVIDFSRGILSKISSYRIMRMFSTWVKKSIFKLARTIQHYTK